MPKEKKKERNSDLLRITLSLIMALIDIKLATFLILMIFFYISLKLLDFLIFPMVS